MTWIAPEVPRSEPTPTGDERAMLESWLVFHRETLLGKCAGLTGEQLVLRSVEPSALSLLGLVRHMAEVERWWFRRRFAGLAEVGDLYGTEEDPDADFNATSPEAAEADLAVFAAECELADAAAAGRGLDETFVSSGRSTELRSLRWIYVHMIEEYARHNGHADLLRERIDGVTGD